MPQIMETDFTQLGTFQAFVKPAPLCIVHVNRCPFTGSKHPKGQFIIPGCKDFGKAAPTLGVQFFHQIVGHINSAVLSGFCRDNAPISYIPAHH